MDSFQVLTKKGLLEYATTYNLNFGKCCVLDKETKVKFDTATHQAGVLFDCVHIDVWILPRLHRLEAIGTLSC